MKMLARMSQSQAAGLTLLAIITVLLAVYFFTGFFGYDDSTYSSLLRQIRYAEPAKASLGSGRWLISVPYVIFAEALGLQPYAAVALQSVEYVVLVLLAVWLTAMLASWWSAIFAGFLVATCPLIVIYSGMLLPDNLLAIFIVIECITVLNAYRAEQTKTVLIWSAITGVIHALAFTIKEPSLLLGLPAPILLLALLRRDLRLGLKASAAMAGGFLLGVLLDFSVNAAIFGDPFARWTTLGGDWVFRSARKAMEKQGFYPLDRISSAGNGISSFWSVGGLGMGPLFVKAALAMPLLFILPFFRKFHFVILGTTITMIVAYHVLGSLSLTEYVGIWLNGRYQAPAAALMAIFVAVAVDHAVDRIQLSQVRRIVGGVFGAAAVLLGTLAVADAARWADRIGDAKLVDETYAAGPIVGALHPGVPIFAGPFVTDRILLFGPVPGIRPVSELAAIMKDPKAYFIVLMTKSEGDPVEEKLFPGQTVSSRLLPPEQQGLWLYKDRWSELAAVFGVTTSDTRQLPTELKIYEVRKLPDAN